MLSVDKSVTRRLEKFQTAQLEDAPSVHINEGKVDCVRLQGHRDKKDKPDTSLSGDAKRALRSEGQSLNKERSAYVEIPRVRQKLGVSDAPSRRVPDRELWRTVRPVGIKDRHSKVNTAKGLRDRRVRLSPATAIQFFDVQDRLGFEQPSKAVDWLIEKAKPAIDQIEKFAPCIVSQREDPRSDLGPVPSGSSQRFSLQAGESPSAEATYRSHPACIQNGNRNDKCEILQVQYERVIQIEGAKVIDEASGLSAGRAQSRAKARERARERTKLERTRSHEILNSAGSSFVFRSQQHIQPPILSEAITRPAVSMPMEQEVHSRSSNTFFQQNLLHSNLLQIPKESSFHGMPTLTLKDDRTQTPTFHILSEQMHFAHQPRLSYLEQPTYSSPLQRQQSYNLQTMPPAKSPHSYTEESLDETSLLNPGVISVPSNLSESVDLCRSSFNQQISNVSGTQLFGLISHQPLPYGCSSSNTLGQVNDNPQLIPRHSSHPSTSGLLHPILFPVTAGQLYEEQSHLPHNLSHSCQSPHSNNWFMGSQTGPGPPFQQNLMSYRGTLQSIFSHNPSLAITSSMTQSMVHAHESGVSTTPCGLGNYSTFHEFASKITANLDESDGKGLFPYSHQ